MTISSSRANIRLRFSIRKVSAMVIYDYFVIYNPLIGFQHGTKWNGQTICLLWIGLSCGQVCRCLPILCWLLDLCVIWSAHGD